MQNQSICQGRLHRLAASQSLLGQPDIISITQCKYTSSFFNKDKKIQDTQQNYINGLVFPTTAHFSSFISIRYKIKQTSKITIKAKLMMFDAYQQKDIHIQLNIPGSLEVKAFDLKGRPMVWQQQDYERAYFSSFLRSLYPMNYPNIILYPLLNRYQILKSIIKNFIQFAANNNLRELNYQFDIYKTDSNNNQNDSVSLRSQKQYQNSRNISLQLLINYCIQNSFMNLLKIVLQELKKINPPKFYEVDLRVRLKQKDYQYIIWKTAQKLLLHGNANRLKQEQIRALFQIKRYQQITQIGKSLIASGGTVTSVSKMILISLMETGDEKKFLKMLNLISNMHNHEQKTILEAAYLHSTNRTFDLENYIGRNRNLSDYPQLCFAFDNNFYNRVEESSRIRGLMKNNSKQGFTLNLLDKIQESLSQNMAFYDILVRYEKEKGWKHIVKTRAECFWLQTDFYAFEVNTYHESNPNNYSFFEQTYQQETQKIEELAFKLPLELIQGNNGLQQQKIQEQDRPKQNKQSVQENQIKIGEKAEQQVSQQLKEKIDISFDGNLSEHQDQNQLTQIPKCSSRFQGGLKGISKINSQTKKQNRILCGMHLQKLFLGLFADIKLQNSIQNWQERLQQCDFSSFSLSKRQIAAMIFLKKGFLHKKLKRNKKCQQSFKLARKMSPSTSINIVAVYQLIMLYIDNKNIKGVEFYLIELIKIIKMLGIEFFDIVPEWAKPIIQFVIDHQGLTIIKNINVLFRNVFAVFLRSNYSQQQVAAYTLNRKPSKQ